MVRQQIAIQREDIASRRISLSELRSLSEDCNQICDAFDPGHYVLPLTQKAADVLVVAAAIGSQINALETRIPRITVICDATADDRAAGYLRELEAKRPGYLRVIVGPNAGFRLTPSTLSTWIGSRITDHVIVVAGSWPSSIASGRVRGNAQIESRVVAVQRSPFDLVAYELRRDSADGYSPSDPAAYRRVQLSSGLALVDRNLLRLGLRFS